MADYQGQTDARERPTAELLKEFSDQATTLLRKEIALAKVEVAEKGKKAAVGAGMFGGSGVFGFYAFGALTASRDPRARHGRRVVAGGVDRRRGVRRDRRACCALRGKAQVKRAGPPVPEQAVDSTKEDLEWVKARAKSARN